MKIFLLLTFCLYKSGRTISEIIGNDVICPGQVSFYQCKNEDQSLLRWSIDGTGTSFLGIDAVGSIEMGIPNATAFLVEVEVDNTLQGNRTSILRYDPDHSFTRNVTITCDSVGSRTVLIVGASTFSRPIVQDKIMMTDKNVTYTWTHPNVAMVDRYNVLLNSTQMSLLSSLSFSNEITLPPDQVFTVNSSKVTITRSPIIPYNVSLSAVDICGRESESVQLEVPAVNMNGSKNFDRITVLLSVLLLLTQLSV